ncbi:MAG: primosomal protein N' [Clostridium sp.]|nr:primosomal protein N' [Clostridium sp.]
MAQGRYANIIIDISHEKVDRTFQYKIPEKLLGTLEEGMCVQIPFGKGDHLRQGYVVEITDKAEFPDEMQKLIRGIAADGVPVEADAIRLAAWMKKNYGSTMIAALRTVLPVKRAMKPKEKKRITRLMTAEETRALLGESIRKHQGARARVLEELCREPVLPYELVTGKLGVSPAALRSLQSQGVISLESESYYRNPVKIETSREAGRELSREQRHISDGILAAFDAGDRKPSLIYGITGSGKTEVYLSLIEGMIARGKQSIVLIPEIALTYQTLLRFYKRFGDRVSVMNSTLSAGEKYDQCERAKKGELDVIIGPRSALFVPFPNLGMIVMDEEHESSYKSETMPRFHARETAQKLAELKGAALVLGSATPSLEAYFRAKKGEYQLFTLSRRLTGGELARTSIVDLREELKSGNRSIFSRKLQELMEERLAKKEQIMLFLNRRGYAGFVSCRSCGYVMKCPHCDVSLSHHLGDKGQRQKNSNVADADGRMRYDTMRNHMEQHKTASNPIINCEAASRQMTSQQAVNHQTVSCQAVNRHELHHRMVCHYCGYETEKPEKCPSCGSPYILGFKAGTQQIEEQLQKRFPGVRVLRMDKDTTGSKDSYEKILTAFSAGEADVLVGTQMIVKGHDFPNVTLVGVLAADLSLNDSDYRAGERTFQLLVQAAGRAGRGNRPGEAVIQTYRPEHYSIVRAAAQDYEAFYEEEILYRELAGYPPAAHMMAVLITSSDEKSGERLAGQIAGRIKGFFPEKVKIIGPAKASVGKINDIYRFVIYCKSPDYRQLTTIKDKIELYAASAPGEENVQFDFNPIDSY